MRLQLATEALLPNESSARLTWTRERYGRSVALVAFGWRLVVDLVR